MLTKSSMALCVHRLSLKTENWGFIFCSHEPWLELQRTRAKSKEKQAEPLKDEFIRFLSVALGWSPHMHSGEVSGRWLRCVLPE